MDYALMGVDDVRRYLFEIQSANVSVVARSPSGFLFHYLRDGRKILTQVAPGGKITWGQKRNNFIARHLVQYKKHKTLRHRLALIAWAYYP